ncbi:hypothetical protein [Bacillus sp. 03113]|uniref:hypothetical protein n=1 Tax=Bacillus sp. 03113 TaxID=2578211 RepID=UPI0015E8C4AF|nr:hypothetical protein [Bacillus sp. 03113]
MKFQKSISLLSVVIIVLSLVASTYGVFSDQGKGKQEFITLHGQTVQTYGKGLYENDSVSVASQAIAQDIVTLVAGIPLLIVAIYLTRKGLLKGKLLLAGTLGYFLYTYTSYTFLSIFNSFFLIDVILMSASFFAFTLTMMSFDIENIASHFNENLPVKFLGSMLIFIAVAIGFMWVGRIVLPLQNGTVPVELEQYTTLVIQALDLGFVVPVAILSGVLVIKRKPIGYLLASIIVVKAGTMLAAITAMEVNMIYEGVKVSLIEIIVFPLFNMVMIYCLILIMKNIKESNLRSL